MPEFTPPFARTHAARVASPLSQWCEGVRRLAEFLPIGKRDDQNEHLREPDFEQFMSQRANPSFRLDGDRIVWAIGLSSSPDCAHSLGLWPRFVEWSDDSQDNLHRLIAQLPRVQKWLMNIDVDNKFQWYNSLCYIVPIIADADPSFARFALDGESWEATIRGNAELSDEQKGQRLESLKDRYFGHVLNNTLLHTFGALANNHFMQIRQWLDHPNLYGVYTDLMPRYLFAVLFQKVRVLRQLRVGAAAVT
jgi:hypothetical protein